MADVKIQALKNGPLMVKGAVDVLDSNGDTMQSCSQVALCRCGHSAKKPLCDGAHNKAAFQSVVIKPAAS